MRRLLQGTASALVLPLALLLFAQWPLREWVQAGSREANDLAQIVFALYVAVAVTVASRQHAHLSTAGAPRPARWRAWALLACIGPWAVFLLWTSAPQMLASAHQLEHFPETLNPGYFIIKLCMGLLLLLALLDAVATLLPKRPTSRTESQHGR